jgi:hypothetical protein
MNDGSDRVKVRERDGIKEFSLKEISEMPLPAYYRKKDKIMNARRETYYDTLIIDPSAGWDLSRVGKLFTRGIGDEGIVTNTGTAFAEKDYFDTNMLSGGEFDGESTVIVHSFEVEMFLCAALPTTVDRGRITNPKPNAEASLQYSASLLFQSIINQTRFTFYRSDSPQETGFLNELTCRLGPTASFGGDLNEGFIQNVIPVDNNRLDRPKVFTNGKFHVRLEPLAALTALQAWVVLRFKMRARRIGELYA